MATGLLTTDTRNSARTLTPVFTSSHIKLLAPIFWTMLYISGYLARSRFKLGNNWRFVDALIWLGRATSLMKLLGWLVSDTLSIPSRTRSRPSSPYGSPSFVGSAVTAPSWFKHRNDAEDWLGLIDKATKEAVDDEKNGLKNETGIEEDKTSSCNSEQHTKLVIERMSDTIPYMERRRKGTWVTSTMGRDLLAVLIHSSLSQRDVASSSSMPTSEILSQISTFLAAGHKTTASALNWCLYELVKHPDARIKLRQSLRELEADFQSVDGVVRESLRVHALVTTDQYDASLHAGRRR
ncbi:hypothetical protein BT96DRAFT_1003207 [Gymnopus androsaceus JB14]|uniref:Cytochrome P450 n=1 Tax=Gymnopus androsaceus JB14 TaxID=1447944 RepID=A0A6A4GWM1_9AGAR|nr:hypothetical protein BT96DRAFT_1003207 [Gymnopus androsaceus JB14]